MAIKNLDSWWKLYSPGTSQAIFMDDANDELNEEVEAPDPDLQFEFPVFNSSKILPLRYQDLPPGGDLDLPGREVMQDLQSGGALESKRH